MADIDNQIKEINGALKDVGDNLKAFAEKAEKQTSRHVALGEETKASVDKLLTEQGELQARLRAAEQTIAALDGGDLTGKEKQTLGQWFAQQDEVKGYQGGKLVLNAAKIGDAVVSDRTGSDNIVAPQRLAGIYGPQGRQLRVRDLLSWGTTTSNSIEYVRESSHTFNAASVGENPTNAKPKSKLEFASASAPVATIAHWVPASKQVLADVAQMAAYIDGRLRYGLDLAEEEQLLKGTGVGLDIDGIFSQATNYAKPSGAVVSDETAIDVLRLALLQAELAEYTADGMVLSPTAWANIELTKDGSKGYIFANPQAVNQQVLWGRSVVSSNSMEDGEFLVGNFAAGAMGWDRQLTSVGIAEQHEDFFVRNMVAILAEKRIALTVFRPDAFVKGLLTGTGLTT